MHELSTDWVTPSLPCLSSSQNLSTFFLIIYSAAERRSRPIHRRSVPLSIRFASGTISHFLRSAAGMWELRWERSAVSRWPFCADSDIARGWEGSIVRVTLQPTPQHQDQICIFIQVKCQLFTGSKNSACCSPWLRAGTEKGQRLGSLISLPLAC